jgi:hypothetical protein
MADTATTALQEELLSSITTIQDATLKVAKGWTKTLSTIPASTEMFTPPKMDGYYGFAEKLFSVQKDFIVSLMEVATEAGKSVPEHVKRTAAAAASK